MDEQQRLLKGSAAGILISYGAFLCLPIVIVLVLVLIVVVCENRRLDARATEEPRRGHAQRHAVFWVRLLSVAEAGGCGGAASAKRNHL